MRDSEPHSHAQGKDLDQWYSRAAEERLAAMTLQNPDDVTPPEFLLCGKERLLKEPGGRAKAPAE
ncbi:hypothetical protein GN244_ATG15993 [Phytophthora infestans]|uniref:Uncharacterized protein n=1 Tax=Phytophthora infestans TaxID=4787 RepID=A0A833T1K5_PHYIN|nr:hypothetical protein GN244_ATG15993 [Phytophthora infestans]